MVEYLKTKKGYFYKLKKNGEKKRISREEFNKKNKTRKNKKVIGGGGEPIEEITENEIETELMNHPAVQSVDVYFNPLGVLCMDILQRNPVIRIIDTFGESYYIDDQGNYMPVLDRFTARVPVPRWDNPGLPNRHPRSGLQILADARRMDDPARSHGPPLPACDRGRSSRYVESGAH